MFLNWKLRATEQNNLGHGELIDLSDKYIKNEISLIFPYFYRYHISFVNAGATSGIELFTKLVVYLENGTHV